MNKAELFWQTYLNFEKELLEVAKYIYITDEKLICCAFCQDKKEKNSRNRCFSAINHSDIR